MMALVICSAPFAGEFSKALEGVGLDAWTLIPKVLGRGGSSDPVMDDEVWPGFSVMFLVYMSEERLGDFRRVTGEFSRRVKPFKVFLLKAEEL